MSPQVHLHPSVSPLLLQCPPEQSDAKGSCCLGRMSQRWGCSCGYLKGREGKAAKCQWPNSALLAIGGQGHAGASTSSWEGRAVAKDMAAQCSATPSAVGTPALHSLLTLQSPRCPAEQGAGSGLSKQKQNNTRGDRVVLDQPLGCPAPSHAFVCPQKGAQGSTAPLLPSSHSSQ